MADMDKALQTQLANIEKKTGKTLDELYVWLGRGSKRAAARRGRAMGGRGGGWGGVGGVSDLPGARRDDER